jgi:hypothetical protein
MKNSKRPGNQPAIPLCFTGHSYAVELARRNIETAVFHDDISRMASRRGVRELAYIDS